MRDKINVLIAEDHPVFRAAIAAIFKGLTYVEHVFEAENGEQCLNRLGSAQIDVVILDINMPEMDGIECLRLIRKDWPSLRVIVFTQYEDAKFYRTLMSLGANGYLLKSTAAADLVKQFEKVVFEDIVVVSEQMDTDIRLYDEAGKELLTQRESEILILICQQFTSEEISDKLQISWNTVSNHRKAIMKKVGTTSVAGMIKWAGQNGLF